MGAPEVRLQAHSGLEFANRSSQIVLIAQQSAVVDACLRQIGLESNRFLELKAGVRRSRRA
jgi:hypothetical protein